MSKNNGKGKENEREPKGGPVGNEEERETPVNPEEEGTEIPNTDDQSNAGLLKKAINDKLDIIKIAIIKGDAVEKFGEIKQISKFTSDMVNKLEDIKSSISNDLSDADYDVKVNEATEIESEYKKVKSKLETVLIKEIDKLTVEDIMTLAVLDKEGVDAVKADLSKQGTELSNQMTDLKISDAKYKIADICTMMSSYADAFKELSDERKTLYTKQDLKVREINLNEDKEIYRIEFSKSA